MAKTLEKSLAVKTGLIKGKIFMAIKARFSDEMSLFNGKLPQNEKKLFINSFSNILLGMRLEAATLASP